MIDDRPYIRRPSAALPPPAAESVSCGVHSARWVRRGPAPERLRELTAKLATLLSTGKGGVP